MKTIISFLLTLFISINIYSQNLERRLDSLLLGHVDDKEIHGCIAYVVQNGNPVLFKTYGYMDIENDRLMEKDAIFRIASMTKPLTAVAALKLYEDGKFLMDDPVKKYIPEFGNLKVISPDCKNIDDLKTISLKNDVTIRDLFRHTAGFGYGNTSDNNVVDKLYQRNISSGEISSLKGFANSILTVPLKYQPGSKWEYSFANDILGYLVEVVSGQPLDKYMDEVIFNPLKMESSGFSVSKDKLNKLCNFYSFDNNKLVLIENSENSRFTHDPAFVSGGGGAVSSAEDYAKFCEMLLNFGEYNSVRILKKGTVEMMISNQIGEIKERSFPIAGYGFGIGVISDKEDGHTSRCYWAGSPYNTTFIIDYDKKMYGILLIQNAPWTYLNLMEKFRAIVTSEIKK